MEIKVKVYVHTIQSYIVRYTYSCNMWYVINNIAVSNVNANMSLTFTIHK